MVIIISSWKVSDCLTILVESSGGLLGSEPKDMKSTPLLTKKGREGSANCGQLPSHKTSVQPFWPGPRPADGAPAYFTSLILPVMPGQPACPSLSEQGSLGQGRQLECVGQPFTPTRHSHRHTPQSFESLHAFKCLLHAVYASWNILSLSL